MALLAPASRLLKLSSHDKLSMSNSNSDFIVSFNNVRDISNARGFIIKHVSFPNIFYNIRADNNILKFHNGSGVQTLVVPPGFYNITQLMAYIQASGFGPILSQDATTYKIKFDNGAGMANYIIYASADGSTIAHALGISADITVNIGQADYAQNPPALQGLGHVYIQSRVLSGGNAMITPALQNAGYICMVPIKVPFGAIEHYESQHEMLDLIEFTSARDIREIDIKVVKSDGELLDLQGGHLNIVLKVYTNH